MKLGREFSAWFDAAENLKLDLPNKRSTIYIDEESERATRERLAAVLAFPKTAAHFAVLVEKQTKGTLYEMPSATRTAARQSLRILPA
jgi:hypothetical protein